MRKNTRQVIEAFRKGVSKRPCDAIWTDGEDIYSYDTCLVARVRSKVGPQVLVYNLTQYSITTTIHQNALYGELIHDGHRIPVVGQRKGVTADALRQHGTAFVVSTLVESIKAVTA
jgi:hypothetical protein